MEEMREIVDIDAVDTAVKVAAIAFPLLCMAVAAGVGWARGSLRPSLLRGAALAVLGPLVLVGWWYHLWITRYDPETGYFGLDKVWVLVVSFLLFVAAGAAYGIIAGRIWAAASAAPTEAESTDEANEASSPDAT